MRILIVGGYGTFGGRLAQLLVDTELTIIIAGRSLAAARDQCSRLRGRAELVAARFDRDGDLDAQLAALAPTLVVDASGPFQVYGAKPYRLVEACIARGLHYLDLADGAEFVAGIDVLDAQAKARGVIVLSGASTCPVLTAAVVTRLTADASRVESVIGGIAPSAHAGVGLSVIKAFASYAGERIRVWRDGSEAIAHGLLEQRWVTISPPGALPLHARLFSLIEVPDSSALPSQWPEIREVWLSAAPVPLLFHRCLLLLARLRRYRLFPAVASIASLMHFVTLHFSWGEHRGGMFVRVTATCAQDRRVVRTWHLVAEGDSGPFIPSIAAESIVRKLLAGARIEPGARTAMREVTLEDYEHLFARHAIKTGVREDTPDRVSIFERVLGDTWRQLPSPLCAMHRLGSRRSASGTATVERGSHPIARVLATVIGLPAAGRDVPITVSFELTPERERWTRRFAGREFHSEMTAGREREAGLLIERFGPFSLAMALVWNGAKLDFVIRRWRLGPVVLPLWLAPISNTHETVVDGRFYFDVSIRLRFVGLLVRYRGWLESEES